MDKEEILKLTDQLYKLTLFFPKKEPLRYKMREIGDEILELILGQSNFSSEELSKLNSKLEILDGFFEIARRQNWVKSADILTLQREYQNLKIKITPAPLPLFSFQKPKENQNLISSQKKEDEQISPGAEARQKKILEILKEKGTAQVWEMKKFFPGVSKRTLRRDFSALLRKGLVERVGEKNITFYRLKTSEI
jgi:DNA-binding transcriptional ArsR family regulator